MDSTGTHQGPDGQEKGRPEHKEVSTNERAKEGDRKREDWGQGVWE